MTRPHKLPVSARKFIRREKARLRATLPDAATAQQAVQKLIIETAARYSKKKIIQSVAI